jgi:DNA-directed RNA polymerase specialized sigma24 family protein
VGGWRDLSPETKALIEGVCTEEQLYAYKLHLGGVGYGRIGRHLHISTESARGRVDRAKRNIEREMRREEAA